MAKKSDREAIWTDFRDGVNMTPKEIERWLETDESRKVGAKDDGGESVGHASGRRIVEIRNTKKADLTDDQWEHMRKVAGYIARHSKQRPKGDVSQTNWRYSLMNWGHDPLK